MFSTFLLIVSIAGRVLPQYQGRVLPQYQSRVLPQYQSRVLPQYQSRVLPQYQGRVLPQYQGRVLPQYQGRVLPQYQARVLLQYHGYDDDWAYSLGDDWDVSNNIAASNRYYNTWQHMSAQMDQHAFAQHMGKIYRGQLANPEINFPGDRAFGHDSDFNSGDFAYESGAFEYKSKGQKVVATQAHVDLNMATKIGEYVIVPPGVQVLPDGSITVQSSHPLSGHRQHNPCNPNPCSKYKHHHECVAVNAHTAKCSPCGDYQLVLSWTGATGKTAKYDLLLVPEKKEGGTLCDFLLEEKFDYIGSTDTDDECGTEPGDADSVSGTEFDDGDTTASTTHTLTTSAVSLDIPTRTSSYHDYIYQIFLHQDPSDLIESLPILNFDLATPVLTVKYKGVKVADFAVPQGGANSGDLNAYFFGCFVPQSNTCGGGYINEGGSGYYNHAGALVLGDAGLCSATRKLPKGVILDRAINTCECAKASSTARIVGGKEVSPKHKLPYQVFFEAGGFLCGGTIINRRYIITAAHCLIVDGIQISTRALKVTVGEHNICDGVNEGGKAIKVEEVHIRSDYSDIENVFVNDLAILKLAEDIKFTENIKPACLPEKEDKDYSDQTAIISGWGGTVRYDAPNEPEQPEQCELKESAVMIVSPLVKLCSAEIYGDSKTRMCGFAKGTDTCQGDSGGPLAVVEDGKYVLVGVSSYGTGCASRFPGVYARVQNYMGWIKKLTADGECKATATIAAATTTKASNSDDYEWN